MPKDYFKKTLAGIFTLAIVASATPLAPFAPLLDSISITASAAEATAEGLEYEESEDGKSITITGYSGTSPDVVIPAEIDGKPVTVIGEEAFHGTGIQTIVLNEGLERIEACAFWESSITSVTFPKSLCYIGYSAFYFCENLEYVRFLNSNCEMGYDYCFSPFIECENDYDGCFLKTVYCPTGSSEYYCEWAFNGYHEGLNGAWTFVEESPIPDSTLRWSLDENGVMTISGDDEAFPAFSDEMGNWTHWCDAYSNVTSIVFETPYLTSIGSGAFADFTGLTSLELPDTVESIGKDAFNNCNRLASVELPAALLSLGQGAFFGCSALEEVVLPSAVTTIGQAAFGCCSKLISVTIPKSVKSIDVDLFFKCDAMQTVNYTGTVDEWNAISIGSSNSELNNIPITYNYGVRNTIPNSTLTWEIDENGVLTISGDDEAFPDFFDEVNPMPIVWCDRKDEVKEVVFDTPKLENLGSAALVDFENLTSVKLPETLTSIGAYAFVSCFSLSSVTIPDSVKSIGYGAFGNCSALTQIVIPDSVTSIGDYAFYGCYALTEIKIPDSVTSIGASAFEGCPDLKNVYYTGSESDWESVSIDSGNDALKNATITYNYRVRNTIPNSTLTWEIDDNGVMTISGDDEAFPDFIDEVTPIPIAWCDRKDEVKEVVFNTPNLTSIGRGAFGEFSNLESIELPNSLIMIGDIAFVYCTSLEKIEFPNTLTTIGDSAFYGCEKLESIELPDSLTTLGGGAFGVCKALKSIKLSAAMTSIPECAFMYAAIESFTIPAGITEIGDFAFGGCTNLKAINVEADNSNYCSVDGVLFNKDKTALMQYPIGKEDATYTVPDTVTSILEGAFCYAESLTDITLPDFLTTIEDSAFGGTKIKSITIPDTVTKIDSWTFGECEDLTSVIIPDSVTEIGSYAFEHCSSLADVTLSDSLKNIGEYAFADCPLLTDITIPASVTNVGEGVFEGSGLKSATFECDDADAIANFNPDEGCYIFYGCTDLETIYVPAGCADSYKNSDGYKAALGDYIDLIQEMPIAEAKGYSVSYNGDITINFHYLLSDFYNNGYVKFSDGTQFSASDAVKDASGYYVFPISMPAKNMYDEIIAQFYDANDAPVGNAVTFDLVTYMDKVKAYDPNYSDFVDSFLEYGMQAAAYFGITNAPSSNKAYNYDSIISALSNKGYDKLPEMGDTYVGATMLLKSTPILRLYYKEEVDGLNLGDNEKWDKNELNPDLTFIQKEISATNFDTTFNGYSVYHYFYKALGAGDEKLMKLCASLYEFSKAADAMGK